MGFHVNVTLRPSGTMGQMSCHEEISSHDA